MTTRFSSLSRAGWLLALLPGAAWAHVATCSSQWTSLDNSFGQDPCTVAAYLLSPCANGVVTNLQPLPSLEAYGSGPNTQCTCSTVVYAAVSACALCQGGTWNTWSEWSNGCDTKMDSVYPFETPVGTTIPAWAFIDVEASNDFDVRLAMAAAISGDNVPVPNHSVHLINPTPTSTLSSTPPHVISTLSSASSSIPSPTSSSNSPSISATPTSTASSSTPTTTSSSFSSSHSLNSTPSTAVVTIQPSSASSAAPVATTSVSSTAVSASSGSPRNGIIITVLTSVLLACVVLGSCFGIIRRHRKLQIKDVEQLALQAEEESPPPTSEMQHKWDFVAVPLTPLTASLTPISPTKKHHAPWFNPPVYSESILHYLSIGSRSGYNKTEEV